ncbi:MAG: stage 0 sporulation protein [Bacilli bacterium]|nr:stage 0 sporulation protein [Bacilli bacterium]
MEPETSGYYLGIKFQGSEKSYYFSCPSNDFALGDLVIVMTAAGIEAGIVSALPVSLAKYTSTLELKPILRKADERDIRDYKRNLEDAKRAMAITRKEVAALSLSMDLIDAYYTIDGSKITITYTSSEKRVDFRELLKVLAPQLGCRIELRQIASRDKAKMIGGLGICGLPLCCSTFLTQFEGISIQRAKNQMLTLNIPKLSGPCGKLICCLTYEDEAYTAAKKEFPRIGETIKLEEGVYAVDSYNILSKTIRVANSTRSDYKTYSLEDYRAIQNGTYVRRVEIVKAEEAELPSFNIKPAREHNENPRKPEQKNQKQQRNDGKNRPNAQNNPQNGQQNKKPQQKPNNRNGNQQQKGNNEQRGNNQPRPQHGNPNRRDQNGQRQNNNQNQRPNPQKPPRQADQRPANAEGQQNQEQRRNNHNHRNHHHRRGNGGGNRGGEGGAQ